METTALFKEANGEAEPTREDDGPRIAPAVDIFENAEGFLIVADLPGVEASGLTLEYNPRSCAFLVASPRTAGRSESRSREVSSWARASTRNRFRPISAAACCGSS